MAQIPAKTPVQLQLDKLSKMAGEFQPRNNRAEQILARPDIRYKSGAFRPGALTDEEMDIVVRYQREQQQKEYQQRKQPTEGAFSAKRLYGRGLPSIVTSGLGLIPSRMPIVFPTFFCNCRYCS